MPRMSFAEGSSKDTASFARRALRAALWALVILVLTFVIFVLLRIPVVLNRQKSAELVTAIQAQKLTMADVDGSHLPPPPDPAQVDATIAGIDVNHNGIRDDVELAIFKKYPNNPQLRAAELQYAMTEQMFLTDVIDQATWKVVAEEDDRAYQCIASTVPRDDIQTHLQTVQADASDVQQLVLNTKARQAKSQQVAQFTTSFGTNNNIYCDANVSSSVP